MKTVLIATLAALIAAGSTAYAQTSNVFGNGGNTVHFDAACHRPTWAKPNNLSNREGDNVTAQQARCLVRRPTFAACVHKLGPPPTVEGKFDHGVGKPGDWTNVDQVAAYEAAIYKCSIGTF